MIVMYFLVGCKMEKQISSFLEFIKEDKKLSENTLQSVAYANSSIALSRIPFKSIFFGWSNNNSISDDVKILGAFFSTFGD